MNHDIAALPEVLQDAGYFTAMAGKWHLGYKDDFGPHARGFDRSFAMLPGCANHFGWEPAWNKEPGGQRPAKFVPGHSAPLYTEDGTRHMPTPNTVSDPSRGFYSSNTYAETLIRYLETREDSSQPFFAFLPFGAPHYPLQCPPADRDKYAGKYADGPDSLRLRRLDSLRKIGMVPKDAVPHPVVAGTAEWDTLTAEEKKMSARSMEIFAGMVDGMDQAVGKMVEYLRSQGELDNTIIMFMSDNGAEAAAWEGNAANGPDLLATIDKYYDNSYENLGNYNSFCWYGPRWAQASTAPGRLYKAYNTEGGIRVPLIVRYPKFTGHAPGTISSTFATCMDVMPTLLDLAGVKHPNQLSGKAKVPYRGHMVYPMRGKSWVPHLASNETIYGDEPVGWEMFGRAAMRKGKWKINWMTVKDHGKGTWELHDLSVDPGENVDLAEQYPEKLQELVDAFDEYVEQTGTVWGLPLDMTAPRRPLPADMIGGDPIADQRAWMAVGRGGRLPKVAT
jgi:arylsulfatase A-like enzyme